MVEERLATIHGNDVVPSTVSFLFFWTELIPGPVLVLDPSQGGGAGRPEPLHRVVFREVVDDLLAADGHDLVVDEAL